MEDVETILENLGARFYVNCAAHLQVLTKPNANRPFNLLVPGFDAYVDKVPTGDHLFPYGASENTNSFSVGTMSTFY